MENIELKSIEIIREKLGQVKFDNLDKDILNLLIEQQKSLLTSELKDNNKDVLSPFLKGASESSFSKEANKSSARVTNKSKKPKSKQYNIIYSLLEDLEANSSKLDKDVLSTFSKVGSKDVLPSFFKSGYNNFSKVGSEYKEEYLDGKLHIHNISSIINKQNEIFELIDELESKKSELYNNIYYMFFRLINNDEIFASTKCIYTTKLTFNNDVEKLFENLIEVIAKIESSMYGYENILDSNNDLCYSEFIFKAHTF